MTVTDTPTLSATETHTHTFTETASVTITSTQIIFTLTVTPTFTMTSTDTNTPTRTRTATDTLTDTHTFTLTPTFTATATPTNTQEGAPVNLDITITSSGDDPAAGAQVTYRIKIENNDPGPVYNIRVWDTLPSQVEYLSSVYPQAPVQTGSLIIWELPADYVLEPGEELIITFKVVITSLPQTGMIMNSVSCDYNDMWYNTPANRHPAVESAANFYPEGLPVFYPNPFNSEEALNGTLKIDNLVPGSMVQIYTLSGEIVASMTAVMPKLQWNAKNRYGKAISPGIYFYTVKNSTTGSVRTGKIFVVK